MTAGNGKATAEAEIRALIDEQAKAIRAKDIDGSLSGYAPDVLLFDVVNPLRSVGSDAVRKRLAAWFASFRGPIGYELRDLGITAGEDVAFGHSLKRVSATTTDGQSSTCGGGRPSAIAGSTARGWSRTSMPRCRSTSRMGVRRWTSSRSAEHEGGVDGDAGRRADPR